MTSARGVRVGASIRDAATAVGTAATAVGTAATAVGTAATAVRTAATAARTTVTTQRGSAALIGLALSAFVLAAALVTVDLGALAAARARAQTAADLAALAAVTPYPGDLAATAAEGSPGVDRAAAAQASAPSGRASAIAAANGAQMVACGCEPLAATVAVRVRLVMVPFSVAVQVSAYARAVLPVSLEPGGTDRAKARDVKAKAEPKGPGPLGTVATVGATESQEARGGL